MNDYASLEIDKISCGDKVHELKHETVKPEERRKYFAAVTTLLSKDIDEIMKITITNSYFYYLKFK